MLLNLQEIVATGSTAGGTVVVFSRVWAAAVITGGFAVLARLVRAVDTSGAVAGAALSFLLYVTAGPGGFAGLVSVFVLAFITTRLGYSHKQVLGTAERRSGRRASQIVANLSVATACSIIFILAGKDPAWLVATAAALSEAGADTVSSEYGQSRSDYAYLITNWQQVPAGTDGGITVPGTMAGIAAAVLIALVCAATGVIRRQWIGIAAGAAVIGMLADSYLGAWLERRRRLGNDAVNFFSTVIAATLAYILLRIV